MTKRLGAMLAAGFILAVSAIVAMSGVSSAATICTGSIQNTTINGDVIAAPFPASCSLSNVTVNGNLYIQPGARFIASNNTKINGNVYGKNVLRALFSNTDVAGSFYIDGTSTVNSQIFLCGGTIGQDVFVQNVNSPNSTMTIGGTCGAETGNNVGGNVYLTNNKTLVGGPFPGLAVTNNTIGGSLVCTANTPPAVASGNTVGGQTIGECTPVAPSNV